MWTVVYLANSLEAKDSICKLLLDNGIISRVSEIKTEEAEGNVCFNVLVPEAEVGKAHKLILDEEI